ncbi:hypothetical protein KEM52_002037, partial [Ascosphaera acerosa]
MPIQRDAAAPAQVVADSSASLLDDAALAGCPPPEEQDVTIPVRTATASVVTADAGARHVGGDGQRAAIPAGAHPVTMATFTAGGTGSTAAATAEEPRDHDGSQPSAVAGPPTSHTKASEAVMSDVQHIEDIAALPGLGPGLGLGSGYQHAADGDADGVDRAATAHKAAAAAAVTVEEVFVSEHASEEVEREEQLPAPSTDLDPTTPADLRTHRDRREHAKRAETDDAQTMPAMTTVTATARSVTAAIATATSPPSLYGSSSSSSSSLVDDIFNVRLLPNFPSSVFRSGSKFRGKQTSQDNTYDVNVDILYVDMAKSYVCGNLHIAGLTPQYPVLSTFFEGEIIGSKYSFFTNHPSWGADEDVDIEHWSRFDSLRALRHQARQPNFCMANLLQRNHIFMRWKEQFLVDDHRVKELHGASFDGFYYICLNKVTGSIEGIYYHKRSDSRFQNLSLEHVDD